VTVLDPACGSGAFLFAALNVLEPLYEACLDRMEAFLEEFKKTSQKRRPDIFAEFERILARVAEHPNRRYFVLKSIILNNLFGVDIMAEAVEICKLRLFLKLAAQVAPNFRDSNLGIEPLPDVDFNIKVGNTLVGFATYAQVEDAITSRLDFCNTLAAISARATELQQLFDEFRGHQVGTTDDSVIADKKRLRDKLTGLEDELNHYLAADCGVDSANREAYSRWLLRDQPFHWFVEFYGIMAGGGFNVVIGNPPYVELAKVKGYQIRGLRTVTCGNLYCPMLERFTSLGCSDFRIGVIVPLSLSCTQRMSEMRSVLQSRLGSCWISHFSGDAHPSTLFEGVKFRLDVVLGVGGSPFSLWSSRYLKWFADARPTLFDLITYEAAPRELWYLGLFPKVGTPVAQSTLRKILSQPRLGRSMSLHGKTIYVHRVITMFIKCFDFVPYFYNDTDGVKKSEDYKPYAFAEEEQAKVAVSALNSSTFFFYFVSLGDCFHCGREFVLEFPFDIASTRGRWGRKLSAIGQRLCEDLRGNAVRKRVMSERTGVVEYDEFWPSKSKAVLDEIDCALAQAYGFTEEELDFVVSFDVKYRLGRDGGESIES
jgi:hypothetical protein